MILKNLRAYNFVTYKELNISSFPAMGLIGITGWNYDSPIMGSNAVGKSLFLDLITYAWHGEVVRKKRANIVGPFNKSMELEIVIADPTNKDEFIIRRTKGKTSGEKVGFTVNGEKFLGTPTKIQPIIDKVFGMGWLTAKNCIIYSDEASHDHFMHVTDARQKEIFSEIADILHIRVARKLIMRDLKKETEELRFTQGQLEFAKLRKEDAKKQLEKSENKRDNFKAENITEIKQIKKKIESREKNVRELKKIQRKIKKVSKEIEELSHKLHKLNKKLRSVDLQALHDKHQKAVKARARQQGTIDEHQDQMQAASILGECPTCFGPMTEKANARIKKMVLMRNAKLEKLREKEERVLQAYTKAVNLDEEQNAIEGTIEYHKLLKAREEKKIEKLNTIVAEIMGLKSELKNISDFSKEYKEDAEKAEQAFQKAQREFSTLFFEEKSRLHKVEAMEFWRKKYGPTELEADFIADLIAELEAESNRNIRDLTDGSIGIRISPFKTTPSGEKQEIVIEVIDQNKTKDFRLYSGGQKNRIEKAISIGLMSLQEGHIRLKLFDEIGKNLSPEGYGRVVALMKDTFNGHQIFIATNNPEIQKFFDYKMTVTMRDGQSRIETNWS